MVKYEGGDRRIDVVEFIAVSRVTCGGLPGDIIDFEGGAIAHSHPIAQPEPC